MQPDSFGEISLSRIIFHRKGIDPAKISGPYSLFAVMLLVAETVFVIWFCKAQSSIERSIAGSIMAVVFVSLMLFVMKMNHKNKSNSRQRKNRNDSYV